MADLVEQTDFMPCPTCGQYSHSIGEDAIAKAFLHFQSMIAHPVRGHSMGNAFDDRTRNAAQVLVFEIERLRARLEWTPEFGDDGDGISCRNDTIKLQDERIARLTERLRASALTTERREAVAQALYERGPTIFTGRVYGECEMAWQEAQERRTDEYLSALSNADAIIALIAGPVSERNDDGD